MLLPTYVTVSTAGVLESMGSIPSRNHPGIQLEISVASASSVIITRIACYTTRIIYATEVISEHLTGIGDNQSNQIFRCGWGT